MRDLRLRRPREDLAPQIRRMQSLPAGVSDRAPRPSKSRSNSSSRRSKRSHARREQSESDSQNSEGSSSSSSDPGSGSERASQPKSKRIADKSNRKALEVRTHRLKAWSKIAISDRHFKKHPGGAKIICSRDKLRDLKISSNERLDVAHFLSSLKEAFGDKSPTEGSVARSSSIS